MSHLTQSQIKEIISLNKRGLSQRAITRLKGYSRETIAKYLERDRERKDMMAFIIIPGIIILCYGILLVAYLFTR